MFPRPGLYFETMLFVCRWFTLVLFVLISQPHLANAQVSKGNQILINRGLQLQGLAQDDCVLTLSTYSNANYTSINWDGPPSSVRPQWIGDPPGFPWARWALDETQMPPQPI